MATTKLGNTKSASRAINYAEKRAVVKDGINCDVDYAKTTFKAAREAFGKDKGVEAHTIIQSFKPGEIEKNKANEIGIELAKRVAKDYQVTVYTHDDKEHIHNHIVINSVNLDTGKKYQSNAKQRNLVKEKNDEVCRENGLSVPKRDSAKEKYTLAEKEILQKGQASWKDEIREVVDLVKHKATSFKDFGNHLKEFGIDFKVRGKNVTYKHPDTNKKVRGSKLGADYDKGGLERGFERQTQRRAEQTKSRDGRENRANKQEVKNDSKQSKAIEREHKNNRDDSRKRRKGRGQDGPELSL